MYCTFCGKEIISNRVRKNRKYCSLSCVTKMNNKKLWKNYNQGLNYELHDKTRDAFDYALKSGKITALPCQVCGSIKSVGHHDDYSKPFDVKWFCRRHHVQYHINTLIPTALPDEPSTLETSRAIVASEVIPVEQVADRGGNSEARKSEVRG